MTIQIVSCRNTCPVITSWHFRRISSDHYLRSLKLLKNWCGRSPVSHRRAAVIPTSIWASLSQTSSRPTADMVYKHLCVFSCSMRSEWLYFTRYNLLESLTVFILLQSWPLFTISAEVSTGRQMCAVPIQATDISLGSHVSFFTRELLFTGHS